MSTEPSTAPLRVAIQGIAGCFHNHAAAAYFGERTIATVECDTFDAMFEELELDASLIAVMAIENTIAGSIMQNHELLRRSNLRIVGEYKMRISHVLCALPGQSIDDIREVHSHPIALRQCENFLHRHRGMKLVEDFDTAGSARNIARDKTGGIAAVCGDFAAGMYGLDILAEGIETNKRNFTRFLVLADPLLADEFAPAENEINKASVVFTLPHTKGALSKVLTILSFYDINLSKIQSSPIIGREWEYRFYADFTFDSLVRYRQAVEAVRPLTNEFKILGEYREFTL